VTSAHLFEIEQVFKNVGGEWVNSPSVILEKLSEVKAYVFDWDGVFNAGFKGGEEGSPFSEVDSMGTNMLRFGHWLKYGELPVTAIITGERNPSAIHWAKRENLNSIYVRCADKMQAIHHLCYHYKIEPRHVAYFFDDILDLRVASMVGVRVMIGRGGSPLLSRKVRQSGWADYITGFSGYHGGLREGCEMLLGVAGQYDRAISSRMNLDTDFKDYFSRRKQVACTLHLVTEEGLIQVPEEQ
jgi:3-deoxy-D-manno-octulosonate 8-phosphate phosphatase (KDO 8-P phosphatase)